MWQTSEYKQMLSKICGRLSFQLNHTQNAFIAVVKLRMKNLFYLSNFFSTSSAWMAAISRLAKARISAKSVCMEMWAFSCGVLKAFVHIIQTFSGNAGEVWLFGTRRLADWMESTGKVDSGGEVIGPNSKVEMRTVSRETSVYLQSCSMHPLHCVFVFDQDWCHHVNENEQDPTKFRSSDCNHQISRYRRMTDPNAVQSSSLTSTTWRISTGTANPR